MNNLSSFTDLLDDDITNSQPISFPSSYESEVTQQNDHDAYKINPYGTHDKSAFRPDKGTGECGPFRSIDEIDEKYRHVFSYQHFNLVQSRVIENALYSDKSMVVCAPTGSGKTVVFEMAIVQLLMELDDKNYKGDFKIIYMAPIKALCTERLTEWYPKFTKLGLLCIEVTGDTDVDFSQLQPYRIIITTPEKWDMLTRRWRDHRALVEVIKLFLIDEVHILNDETRGPVLETVVSRMKTIESSLQTAYHIENLKKKHQVVDHSKACPRIRFVAISATVSNPEDVAAWIGTADKPAVFYKFGDECRPVKLKRIVEGYHCTEGTSIFKFDIILNYKLWPIIQKYYNGKPTLIFCNTRKSVSLTAETLSREITIKFNSEQKAKLTALASKLKNKKLQSLIISGVGCHHAGLLFEERMYIESAFRNRDLPILITTTTLAMGVNLPAHLVIIKNTQQYVNGAYQEYSISTVLQMVGRAGRPQFDTEATAVIMTRLADKPRYQALVGGSEPLQSYLHKRLPENLNSEVALKTVGDVSQCVQWLSSTFLNVRAAKDPKRYLGLPATASQHLISKKIEELCVKAMNGLATSGLITMDEASCIESTEAGRLMSIYYLDLETMRHIMKIDGTETLERLLTIVCESHELSDMHLRVDERRCLNSLNRNNAAPTIRFPMKGRITTRQMKLNCIIQAILGCLPIPDPSLNQEAMKIMRIADRVCKCLVAYVTQPELISRNPRFYSAILNSLILAKCVTAHMWENSTFVSRQLKGIGPTFSTLLATAGKNNFMLLEESHPRDLERIMNKGPPAGNVIRKQVSLLPKYQITATPVDSRTLTIKLILLNQSYLMENLENLTAGESHKSYILVGDSQNYLLHISSFKDKDLISVYDGSITYEITRKHSFEHKIFAHCISSNFVGIDDHCEHVFNDLNTPCTNANLTTSGTEINKQTMKQATITDTFKYRKRKNNNDITEPKEKKKRDYAIVEKFNSLKESFGVTSRELKNDFNKSVLVSNKILQELTQSKNTVSPNPKFENKDSIEDGSAQMNQIKFNTAVDVDGDDFMSDQYNDVDKINILLNKIENEMSNKEIKHNNSKEIYTANLVSKKVEKPNTLTSVLRYKTPVSRARKPPISNYNFIDLLQKNVDLSDIEEENPSKTDTGFSEAIKYGLSKYLKNTRQEADVPKLGLTELLEQKELSEMDADGYSQRSVATNRDEDVLISNNHRSLSENSNNLQINKKQEGTHENTEKCAALESYPCVSGNKPLANGLADNFNDLSLDSHQFEEFNTREGEVTNKNNEQKQKLTLDEMKRNLENFEEIIIPPLHANIVNRYDNIGNDYSKNADRSANEAQCSTELTTERIINKGSESENDDTWRTNNIFSTNEESIKSYSYTATKVDVCSKNMPDYCVRVIRKLKVDLDITEIVAKKTTDWKNKKALTNFSSNSNLDVVNSDSSELKMNVMEKKKQSSLDTETNQETYNCFSNDDNIDKSSHRNEIRCNNLDGYKAENKLALNVTSGVKSNEQCSMNSCDSTNYNEIDCDPISNRKIESTKESSTKQNMKIAKVLQKYSQILSQRERKEDIQDQYVSNVTEVSKFRKGYPKSERPFRITEMDNVNIPIPDSLIVADTSSKETPNTYSRLLNQKNYNSDMPYKNENLINVIEDKDVIKRRCELNVPDLILNEVEQVNEECYIPSLNFQNEPNNYNIDQTMFDPKTLLLQCTENVEVDPIIPPPQEFSDYVSNYSPVLDSECNTEPKFQSQYSSNNTTNENTETAFFDTDDINLTPDNLETTSIYTYDSVSPLSFEMNSVQPFSVMDQETFRLSNQSVSAKRILEQFKIDRKDKMKMNH